MGAYGHGVIFLLVAAVLNANYQILTRGCGAMIR